MAVKKGKKVTVKETPEEEKNRLMVEQIAGNIASLSKAVSALLNGQLKKRAIVLLLANSTGMSQSAVENVLKALENLETDWLK